MAILTAMKNHLAEGATYLAHLWKIEERPREIVISWDSAKVANCRARGGYLKKNAGADGTNDAGAQSLQSWADDVYIRAKVLRDGTVYFGLALADSDIAFGTIEYAIRCDSDGTIRVYETGTLKYTHGSAARTGDWIRVQRDTNTVTYWLNRTLLYTSLTSASGTYFADASLTTLDSTITEAVFGKPPVTIRVTDHTRKITFEAEEYVPLPMIPTRFSRASGLRPDNAELTHVLTAGGVTETDIMGGRWDYARYEFMTVNYLDLTMGVAQRAKGRFGEFGIDNGRFTAELRSLSQPLSQEIGDVVGSLCIARRFGDLRCGQPLDSYTHSTTISSVTSTIVIVVGLSPAKANDYFEYGVIYFTDGDNKFYEREIRSNVGNTITLQRPFPFTPEAGDTVTLIAGCNRTKAKCLTFVNASNPSGTNIENFQGFPDVPGNTKVLRYPE